MKRAFKLQICCVLATAAVLSCKDSESIVTPNQNPKIIAVTVSPAVTGAEDTVTVSVSALDPDGDELSYHYTPSGGTILGDGETVKWRAPSVGQDCILTVMVRDTEGSESDPFEASLKVQVAIKDFLPLDIGNKWIYDYEMLVGDRFRTHRFAGQVTWEIISKQNQIDTTFYHVANVFSGLELRHNSSSGRTDTTRHPADSSLFRIIEVGGDVEIIEFLTDRKFSDIAFRQVSGDTLHVFEGHSSYRFNHQTYVRDVGLTDFIVSYYFNTRYKKALRLRALGLH